MLNKIRVYKKKYLKPIKLITNATYIPKITESFHVTYINNGRLRF